MSGEMSNMPVNFSRSKRPRRDTDMLGVDNCPREEPACLARVISYQEALLKPAIYYANSYTRMGAVLDLRPQMPNDEWLRLLGHEWSVCDDVWRHLGRLKLEMGCAGPLLPMMDGHELARYRALPSKVVVYRGAGSRNKNGASWSLSAEVATGFPSYGRYRAPNPTLYTARVWRHHILAVKLDREEAEIITFSAKIQGSEPLTIRDTRGGSK